MLKPHDSGLIWLYFLLAGGVYRKRALQTLLAVSILSLPVVLWTTHIAPDWVHEFSTTLAAYSSHGDVNDPGPASVASHGIGMVICMQAVFAVFRDDPGFYNIATYLLCGIPLLIWLFRTIRVHRSEYSAWFALAPVAVLSVLPVYHRIYDAKLLLLAIPACAILWHEGGTLNRITVGMVGLGIAITGGMPWAIFLAILTHAHLPAILSSFTLLTILQVFPVPITLLITGLLLLWVYLRRFDPGANLAINGGVKKVERQETELVARNPEINLPSQS